MTAHDELFKDGADPDAFTNPAAKVGRRYRQALPLGLERARSSGLHTANHIIEIQSEPERNHAGFRKLSGTALKGDASRKAYTPPQERLD